MPEDSLKVTNSTPIYQQHPAYVGLTNRNLRIHHKGTNLFAPVSSKIYQNFGSYQMLQEFSLAHIRIETPRKREGGPTSSVPKAIRYDNVNHFLQEFSQGRCYVCKKNTRLKCIKCEKRLHKACSINFQKK
ncbi:uncharacterized protein LOC121878792 [Homarus americanus]|uniref:uncharacterized protein LOC121878792 n=1 Tax=Homarus americanus TaxID=6706 RepID=UPI001C464B46|nr:uncharacterized protein LOC121878792 [Homarus americanus]